MKCIALEPFGLLIESDKCQSILHFDIEHLKQLTTEHKVVLLRGFSQMTKDEQLSFCSNGDDSTLLHWASGPMMEMRVNPESENYLFSTESVPLHWDGAFHQSPSFLVFHSLCEINKAHDGETLFTDTERLWAQASDEEKKQWEKMKLTYTTEKKAHYGGTIDVQMVQEHPKTRKKILRYAEPVFTSLNPVTLTIQDMNEKEQQDFINNMERKIYDDHVCYSHQWQKGDFLLCDNNSIIHGRNAFKKEVNRHLRRVQIL